jgi:hypothetical protein
MSQGPRIPYWVFGSYAWAMAHLVVTHALTANTVMLKAGPAVTGSLAGLSILAA